MPLREAPEPTQRNAIGLALVVPRMEQPTSGQAALLLESAILTGCHRKGVASSSAFSVPDRHARVLFGVALTPLLIHRGIRQPIQPWKQMLALQALSNRTKLGWRQTQGETRRTRGKRFAALQNHIDGTGCFWNRAKRVLRKGNGAERKSFLLFLKEHERNARVA